MEGRKVTLVEDRASDTGRQVNRLFAVVVAGLTADAECDVGH